MSSEPAPKILYIDDREPPAFVDLILVQCPITCEPKHLITGDFVCEDVCIERKEIGDFASSIIDGRVFRQCERMIKDFKYPYLLIHGRISEIWSKINPHSVIGAQCFFATHGIPVLCLDSNDECAYAILKIFENHGKLKMEAPAEIKKKTVKHYHQRKRRRKLKTKTKRLKRAS